MNAQEVEDKEEIKEPHEPSTMPSGPEDARKQALKEKIEKLRKEDPNVYPLF